MKQLQCDVLIAGAGGAGLRAALEARAAGADVILVCKGRAGTSGTTVSAASDWMAFGAAFGHADERDSPHEHWIDILVKGCFTCVPELARQIAFDAPARFQELEDWGGDFDKTADGKFVQILSDGARFPRACGKGADTGSVIVKVLLERCRAAGVRFVDNTFLTDLLTAESRVIGAMALDTESLELVCISAPAVVLATGGAGQIYAMNVLPGGMTGDGYAMALRAGADLVNMEFIQIGPSIVWPVKFALSGVFWRLHPRITNARDDEFLHRYIPPGVDIEKAIYLKGVSYPFTIRNESKWVDVAVFTEIVEGRGTKRHGVYMDISHNRPRVIETDARVPFKHLMKFGVDLRKDRIEFAPAVQHFNGGVLVDQKAATGVPGLFAAGEVAGGQHGADRPGGNALADCQVRGRIAGENAARYAARAAPSSISSRTLEDRLRRTAEGKDRRFDAHRAIEQLRWLMWENASVVRTAHRLHAALGRIRHMRDCLGYAGRKNILKFLELRNMLDVSECIVCAALTREESRGTHYRPDTFRVNDPRWRKIIACRMTDGEVSMSVREIDMPDRLKDSEDMLEGADLRSGKVRTGLQSMPARSLMHAAGIAREEFSKPLIGIASSYTDLVPGHIGMREMERFIERGITAGGGVPFIFGVPAICDGIAMGHEGMNYSLASRELIADCVESMVMAHALDGVVLLTSCDKITPAMLMAAGRLNVPAVVVTAGPMLSGRARCGSKAGGRLSLVRDTFEAWIKRAHGQITEEELLDLEINACPGAGSCQGLYTANTMNCLTEALGMSLAGCGTSLAVSGEKRRIAFESGKRIVELIQEQKTPRQIMTREAFENAIRVDMCMGGSTNTILHLVAIAREVGVKLDLDLFERLSRETPQIVSVRPGGEDFMEDVEYAGGIPAVLNVLKPLLKDTKTVNRENILEIAAAACPTPIEYMSKKDAKTGEVKRLRRAVIHSLKKPIRPEGGIAILRGNLAPEGAVVKQSAVDTDVHRFKGNAMVFDSEDEAMDAIRRLPEIMKGKERYVLVIRYEGPRGGPGMPEMLFPTAAISGYPREIRKRIALITDGRFSGGTRGPSIGHVCPEAVEGGPIALIKDGDTIEIDIPRRAVNVKVSDAELKKRKKAWKLPRRPKLTGWLARYAKLVQSATEGAVLKA